MDIDRLMIFVIVGIRTDLHCLRREVGIGSRSQEKLGELDKSAETSAMVAGWKKDSSGGLEAGGQGWAQDLLGRDRDQDRDLSSRDPDETETRPFSGRDYIETHGLYMHGNV